MNKTQIGFLTGIIYTLSFSAVQGAIIETEVDDNGNGSLAVSNIVWIDDYFGGMDVVKEYSDIGPMQLTITVDSDGQYILDEDITNSTGVDWTDFHWRYDVETDGDFSIVFSTISIRPFKEIDDPSCPTCVDVSNGPLLNGESFQPSMGFELDDSSGGVITLTQIPTIPEPATVALMGIGLAGLGYRRFRCRIAK